MSQDMRRDERGGRDISRSIMKGNDRNEVEGFEGMNYEQYRQPYRLNPKGRNSSEDERNESKRPDES